MPAREATTTGDGRVRRNVYPIAVLAFVCDAIVIAAAGTIASLARTKIDFLNQAFDAASSLAVAGPLIVVAWLLVLMAMGAYRASAFGAGSDEYRLVATATLATAGLVGIGCYVARFQLARGFFVFLFVIGLPLLVLERYGLRKALQAARRRGLFRQRVLIVGDQAHVDDVAHVLQRESWLGYDVVGALTPSAELQTVTPGGLQVLGNTDDLIGLADAIDVVFLASGGVASAAQMRRIVWDLEPWGVQVLVAPSMTDVARERVRIRPMGGLPLLHIDPPTTARASKWGKRAFDVGGAALLLVLVSPVLAVAAARIKLHDHGPVLFRQTRVSRGGREFSCLKLRSMVVGAEDQRPGALGGAATESGPLFKLKDDPRITRPGRWLRRYSIDELPQLVNVLRGEMSLVGPRPPLPTEVAAYPTDMTGRLRVRPGMTGLWQVSGRADLSWTEAMRLDLYYVDNWSMLQDLWILGKTVGAVLRSRGAY